MKGTETTTTTQEKVEEAIRYAVAEASKTPSGKPKKLDVRLARRILCEMGATEALATFDAAHGVRAPRRR